ncbi:uncharacterized protein C16orf52 homolog B-like isoform X3 [Varroa destructor]|uniref:Uncharacterized protein n=1 Tax=Varroa destructor TaxID=109461 RepID=A0A7M7KTH3_VARDE|nr:uncharacterized protein C16orf52 homolog B-like isoform X3 [Varroa destructor]
MMDKLTLVSGTLFLSANVFAILSLVLPEWIVSEVGGDTRLGLLQTCLSINGRPGLTCYPPKLQPEWMLTLVCIIIGCICITATTILLAISHRNLGIVHYARWMGFAAMTANATAPAGYFTAILFSHLAVLPCYIAIAETLGNVNATTENDF